MNDKQISITCDGSDYINYKKLMPFQGDLKEITEENLDKLKKSIIKYGFTAPAFVWKNKGNLYILDAHQRQKALNELLAEGYVIPDIPIVYIDAKDKKEAAEKLLHITSQYGEFTEQGYADFILDAGLNIDELNVRLTNEEFSIINPIEEEETEGDDLVIDEVEEITKLDDLWELGKHRLLCGDSTDSYTVERLMNGQKADMVFTDPPYNIDYQGVSDKRDKIKNDKMSDSDFVKFLESSLMGCETMYVCCSWQYAHLFKKAMENISRKPKAMIIWDKINPAQHLDKYFKQHEIIFYYGDFGGHKTLRGDVWRLKRERNTVHPTMKPIELIDIAMVDQPEKKLVYDSFLGSGSTIISSEKNNKTCFGLELDTHYCDVIVNRYKTWCELNDRECTIKLNGEIFDKQRLEQ